MKLVDGIWLPDGDEEFTNYAAKKPIRGYQRRHKIAAFRTLRADRMAVDVGAHVGLWTLDMADIFGHVHAFEPVAEVRECLIRHVPPDRVTVHGVALGEKAGSCGVVFDPKRTATLWASGLLDTATRGRKSMRA